MKYGPPGVEQQDAEKKAEHDGSHDPRNVPENIAEMDQVLKQEELRDILSDEQKNLSEVQRNL